MYKFSRSRPPAPMLTKILLHPHSVKGKRFPIELLTACVVVVLAFEAFIAHIPVQASSLPPVEYTPVSLAEINTLSDDVIAATIDETIMISQVIKEDLERRFYVELIGDSRIVEAVYTKAKEINKDILFAQILKESRGDPLAFSENKDEETGEVISIDRGVFQLNSRSYPTLTEEEFYNIEINVAYGISHLRSELEYWRGNIQKALWTYNAGRAGIKDGVPESTIRYAKDIIANAKAIEQDRLLYIKMNLEKYLAAAPVDPTIRGN